MRLTFIKMDKETKNNIYNKVKSIITERGYGSTLTDEESRLELLHLEPKSVNILRTIHLWKPLQGFQIFAFHFINSVIIIH